jgi:exodeoxyribonuclease V beta subunit
VGLSLTELYALATQDDLLDTRAEQMRDLHLTWQSQGVLAMLRQSLHLLALAGRWRGAPDGERRLTNVLHLAELLQAASSQLDGEQALIRWLVQQIEEAQSGSASGSDEQTVRLESDEDLVKVITIHASKGLEYPVVCLPFAHSHRPVTADKAAVLQLENAAGDRHWTLAFDKTNAQGADRDRLREDLRLWYVALTRAQHALWLGWSPVKRGQSKTCVNHDSAAGHLLSRGQAREAAAWWDELQKLTLNHAKQTLSVALVPAPEVVPLTPWQKPPHSSALHEALHCTARIDKSWTIASFSRLARDLSSQPLQHLVPPRPADDEPPEDAAVLAAATAATGTLSPWHGFAKGPTAGNFLHDQLEWLAADGFAWDASKAERLKRRCENAGYKKQADDVVQWLARVLAQPLRGPNAPLQALGATLPEMEFWLPAARLHAREVDALCQQHLLPGVSRPQLPDAQLHGMLMGFADLVFEHAGRYWVLDYKSNHLGADDAAYTPQALNAAMAQHRYEVQAALYMLALHRLLRARLGDAYDPAQQLGGAVYLFLRGIDGPAGGCCTLPAPLALLEGLDAMLHAEESPC